MCIWLSALLALGVLGSLVAACSPGPSTDDRADTTGTAGIIQRTEAETATSAETSTEPSAFEICQPAATNVSDPNDEPLNQAIGLIEAYGAANPDEWGGWSFLSDEPGGGATIYVTDSVDHHVNELTATLPAGTPFTVQTIDRPKAGLDTLATSINERLGIEFPSFHGGAVPAVGRVRSTGEIRNLIWFTTDRADESTTERLAAAVTAAGAETGLVCLSPHLGPVRASTQQAHLTELRIEADIATPPGDNGLVTVQLERLRCPNSGELAVRVPHSWMIAVERSVLPERFELRLDNISWPRANTSMVVDLSY